MDERGELHIGVIEADSDTRPEGVCNQLSVPLKHFHIRDTDGYFLRRLIHHSNTPSFLNKKFSDRTSGESKSRHGTT